MSPNGLGPLGPGWGPPGSTPDRSLDSMMSLCDACWEFVVIFSFHLKHMKITQSAAHISEIKKISQTKIGHIGMSLFPCIHTKILKATP